MILNEFTTPKMLFDDLEEYDRKETQRFIDLINQYNNKFVIMGEGNTIIGQYDTAQEAYDNAPKIGTFLIQQILHGECIFCNIKNRKIVKWGTTWIGIHTIACPSRGLFFQNLSPEEK